MEKINWMNLPEEYRTDDAHFVILPIEYEKDVTFGTGARNGSCEIIKASKHLEYYDDQFDCEPFLRGIKLLDPLSLSKVQPQEMVDTIVSNISKIQKDKFVIGLGGDHAVTIGMVKGLESLHEEFSVIQFDAHADFRDSWNGSSLNHACVARQISKKHSIALVGIRSMDVDEKSLIEQDENVHLLKVYDYSLQALAKILPKLHEKVFITIDVDAFDPTFIRNTGTPEPGGLFWNDVIQALILIFKEKNVIGADIVEFAPKGDFDSESYALAKLTHKIMGLDTQNKENL